MEFQSFLQNNFNISNNPIFKAFVRGEGEVTANLTNTNTPGSMDILPGSLTNSTEEIVQGIIDGINKRNKDHWKITVKTLDFKPKHTFMPVISSLAFNNTNIDWGQVLNNRDLVCTGEIPFHAYKISGSNQDHITITEDI